MIIIKKINSSNFFAKQFDGKTPFKILKKISKLFGIYLKGKSPKKENVIKQDLNYLVPVNIFLLEPVKRMQFVLEKAQSNIVKIMKDVNGDKYGLTMRSAGPSKNKFNS